MKKLLCCVISVLLLISIAPIGTWAAISYDTATGLPKLTAAPSIAYVSSNTSDEGTTVKATYRNTEELLELSALEHKYYNSPEFIKNEIGLDNGSLEYDIQIAYSLNGGTSWINSWDYNDYTAYTNYDIDDDGEDDYFNMPVDYIDNTLLCDEITVLDFAVGDYWTAYNDLDVCNERAALNSQNTATKVGDDEYTGYTINFNTHTLTLKARYRLYVSYEKNEESKEYITYSPWSDTVSYNNSKQISDFGIIETCGETAGPQISYLRTDKDSEGITSYLNIFVTPGKKLADFITGYESLFDDIRFDEDAVFKHWKIPRYSYPYYYIEFKINDGEWFNSCYSFGAEQCVWSVSNDLLNDALDEMGKTLQSGDLLKMRLRMLLAYDSVVNDVTGLREPGGNTFAYSAYSNDIVLVSDGNYRISYDLNGGDFPLDSEQIY